MASELQHTQQALQRTEEQLDQSQLALQRVQDQLQRERQARLDLQGKLEQSKQDLAESRSQLQNVFKTIEYMVQERTRELADARDMAMAASRAKSHFLATISHEVRTPMNAIVGFSHLLCGDELPSQQRQYVERINGAAEVLLRVINDLLDFSSIEQGKLTLSNDNFALGEVLVTLQSQYQAFAGDKGLQLLVPSIDGLPERLLGDEQRLLQVLSNLVNNAIKFSDRGAVSVSVQESMRLQDRILLEFCVADNGIGIDQKQIDALFASFTQGDNSASRRYGGSGLGLTICRSLVEKMAGDIWVESEIGQGCRFFFTAEFQCAEPAGGNEAGDSLILQGRHILVVDDQEVNRELVKELLLAQGMLVDLADNGLQAVDAVANHEFDGILMDIQMPEMDGYEATRLIRQQNSAQQLPIIALTANATPADRLACEDVGMNAFLTKPVVPERLQMMLGQVLGSSSMVMPVVLEETGDRVSESSIADSDGWPGLDIEAGLALVSGSDRIYRKLSRIFVQSYRDGVYDVTGLLAQNHTEAAHRAAHSLKGVAGNLGAHKLQAMAIELDALFKGGEYKKVQQKLPQFEAEIVQVTTSLAAFLET